MLDQEFCEYLEYEISNAFANTKNEKLKHFWCDGILLPTFESQYSTKFVNDNRKILMTAYLGLDGQNKYELILLFGRKAQSKYARGLDISECVPNPLEDNWLEVDIAKKIIKVQLD
jgi:hypothetical protein